MQVLIEDIKVKSRIRKEMGDMKALAESMKRFGQISPILISKDNVLIAGGRRLEAAKTLGWRTINAVIAEIPDGVTQLEFEIEENVQRREFSSEEILDATAKLKKQNHPNVFRTIWNALVRFFKWIFGG
ncbi:chromosome partitioning protein ParB [Spirochaetia bacterium]|nr:chromosome partitioning protein ParB [Spirochaetia bacterium]